jgi:GT2 family glycosyltransferase
MDATLPHAPMHLLPSLPVSKASQPRVRRQTVPTLSVVIVNYVNWQDTGRLVQQLRHGTSLRRGQAEIVIVDNHSPPHALVPRLRRMPAVSLRRWGRNRGFARAVNEGCRLSQGQWFLLLNPDIGVPQGFVEAAARLAEDIVRAAPDAGIVGFGLRNEDGSAQAATGPDPTFLGTLLRLLLPRRCRKYHVRAPSARSAVPWVTGCCLLIRKECFQALGGLDEDFFLYYEDADLCRRARQKGWSVWHEPALNVVHRKPLHRRTVSAHLRVITRHGLLTYARKHWPRWQAGALCRLVQLEGWVRQWASRWRGKVQAGRVFGRLPGLAGDLARQDGPGARRRLERVVRSMEKQRGA